jgi:hypothetical protein
MMSQSRKHIPSFARRRNRSRPGRFS